MPALPPISIGAPMDGIDTGADPLRQPVGTTRRAVNVRPHDGASGRLPRIATRSGSEKWTESRPCGNNVIQAMIASTLVAPGGTILGPTSTFTDNFTRADTAAGVLGDFTGDASSDYNVSGNKIAVGTSYYPDFVSPIRGRNAHWNAVYAAGLAAKITSNKVEDNQNISATGGTPANLSAIYFKPTSGGTLPTDNYSIKVNVRIPNSTLGSPEGMIGFFCCGKAADIAGGSYDGALCVAFVYTPTIMGWCIWFNDTGNSGAPSGVDWSDPCSVRLTSLLTNPMPLVSGSSASVTAANNLAATSGYSVTKSLEMRVNGKRVEILIDGVTAFVIADMTVRGDGAATPTPVKYGVAGYTDFGVLAYNMSAEPSKSRCNYIDDLVVTPTSLQQPATGIKVAVVSGGDVCVGTRDGFAAASSGTGLYIPTKTVCLIPGLGGPTPYAYIVDGSVYKKLDLNLQQVSGWSGGGNLPTGSTDAAKKANFGVRHRQRIFLFGIPTDPYSIWCSRYGNAEDWNDTPATPDGYESVSFDDSDIGLPPFPVTCLAPFDADYMVIGGDRALAIMVGDPAQGGVIDDLSDQTGICSHLAYARDREGNLYIMGFGGVYLIPRGTRTLINLTLGKIDNSGKGLRMKSWLESIDFSTTFVELAWDTDDDGLRVLLRTKDWGVSDVLSAYWDRQTDSWWLDSFPDAQVPTATCNVFDDDGTESLLLGGRDGYIRRRGSGLTMDDGSTIQSELWLPTLAIGANRRCLLNSLEATLGAAGDEAAYSILATDTPDAILSAGVKAAGTWRGTRRQTVVREVAGEAVAVKLSTPAGRLFDASRFSLSEVQAYISDAGVLPRRLA